MDIHVGQFAVWALAAVLIAGAVIGVLAFIAWERIRRGHDPAAALFQFQQRWAAASIMPVVVLGLVAAQAPGFWTTHLHLQLVTFIWMCWLALIVLSLALRLVIERKVRTGEWSVMAMFQVQLYFLLPLMGTIGVSLLGALATVWVAGLMGHDVPMWIGAVWLAVATPLVMLAPTGGWLGRRMELPAEVAALYREKLAWDEPPEVVAIDTRGARFANAFAFWRPGRRWLAVTDGALEELTPIEVAHLLLHETGHHVHHDSRRLFLALMLAQIAGTAALVVIGWGNLLAAMLLFTLPFALVVAPLTRKAEQRADRFVVEHGGDPQVYGEALRKLHAANLLPARMDSTRSTHPDLVERLELIGAPMSEEETSRVERAAFTRSRVVFDLLRNMGWLVVAGVGIGLVTVLIPLGAWEASPINMILIAGSSLVLYQAACGARRAMRRMNGKPVGQTGSPMLVALLVTYWPVLYEVARGGSPPVYLPYAAVGMFVGVWWIARQWQRRRSGSKHGASRGAKQPMA